MIVTADWVVPVSSPPVRDGAVVIRHGRFVDVGPADRVTAEWPAEDVRRFDGHILAPGLVNAHTHLSLSALGDGLVPSTDMAEWLAQLVARMRGLTNDDLADSAALGAMRCISSGTTVVGDIAYGPEAPAAAADAGLGGVFFWEVLGITPSELPEYLAEREYPGPRLKSGGRISCAISPHSAYTCGPALLQAVRGLAREQACACAIHVAESPAEQELLAYGDGQLAAIAERLALGFHPPRRSPVGYLDALGVLEGSIAVHCTQVDGVDADRLANRSAGVVLCPRSNAYLRNGPPPVAELLRSGVRLALGTDSAASNEDLDLFAEARALARLGGGLSGERILRMITLEGAEVLGCDDEFGSVDKGKHADLIAVTAPPTDDPVSTLLQAGGADTVSAVLASGVWRVLDGMPTFRPPSAATARKRSSGG